MAYLDLIDRQINEWRQDGHFHAKVGEFFRGYGMKAGVAEGCRRRAFAGSLIQRFHRLHVPDAAAQTSRLAKGHESAMILAEGTLRLLNFRPAMMENTVFESLPRVL